MTNYLTERQFPKVFPVRHSIPSWAIARLLRASSRTQRSADEVVNKRHLNFNLEIQKELDKKMPEIRFTQEDILERTQLSPGWRTLVCKSVTEGQGKTDPTSTVYTCMFSVDNGSETGVPIRHWFSEKAMGRIVDYIRCFVPASLG